MIKVICVSRGFKRQIFRPKDQLNLSDAHANTSDIQG